MTPTPRLFSLVGCVAVAGLIMGGPALARDPARPPDPGRVDEEEPGLDAEEPDLLGEEEPDLLRAEVTLRAYAIYPKFRFRDGHAGRSGDSFRTQKIGLDDWCAAPGVSAGLWLRETDWLGLHGWTFSGGGEGVLTQDMQLGNRMLLDGARVRTDYQLTYFSLEYLHRFELLGGLVWIDGGLRLEYLDFRANVVTAGRVLIEAAWPSPRLHVGLRPLPWLELEGRFGGFQLDIPVASTRVTQALEVGGLVRLRLPGRAFIEVGALLFHVHLEEDPGDLREDALHLRHRAVFASLGIAF